MGTKISSIQRFADPESVLFSGLDIAENMPFLKKLTLTGPWGGASMFF
jgi:hypothetical protein